jgi:hypothetical protein
MKRKPGYESENLKADVVWVDNEENEYHVQSKKLAEKCTVFADLEWEDSQTFRVNQSSDVVTTFLGIVYESTFAVSDSNVIGLLELLTQYGCSTSTCVIYLSDRIPNMKLLIDPEHAERLSVEYLFWKERELPAIELALKHQYFSATFRGRAVRCYIPEVEQFLELKFPTDYRTMDLSGQDLALREVMDSDSRWLAARIELVTKTHYFVHFLCWNHKWDEWIPIHSDRIKKCGSKSLQTLRIHYCETRSRFEYLRIGKKTCDFCGTREAV